MSRRATPGNGRRKENQDKNYSGNRYAQIGAGVLASATLARYLQNKRNEQRRNQQQRDHGNQQQRNQQQRNQQQRNQQQIIQQKALPALNLLNQQPDDFILEPYHHTEGCVEEIQENEKLKQKLINCSKQIKIFHDTMKKHERTIQKLRSENQELRDLLRGCDMFTSSNDDIDYDHNNWDSDDEEYYDFQIF